MTKAKPPGLPRPFLIVAVVLGLLGIAWAALVIISITARRTDVQTRTYPVAQRLAIDMSAGDVTVVGERRDDVRVEARQEWSLAKPKMSQRFADGRLELSESCTFWGSIGSGCEGGFRVRVPLGTALDVHATSGEVHVAGLAAPVKVRTASGDIDGEDLGGPVDVQAASGEIRVEGYRGRDVSAVATSGDVAVDALTVPDRLRARATSGDVHVVVPQAVYHVEATTGSGDQHVDVDQSSDSSHVIEATTGSGDVHVARLGGGD